MITRQGPSHMGSDFLVATAPRRSVRFRLLRNPTGTKLQCSESKRFGLYICSVNVFIRSHCYMMGSVADTRIRYGRLHPCEADIPVAATSGFPAL